MFRFSARHILSVSLSILILFFASVSWAQFSRRGGGSIVQFRGAKVPELFVGNTVSIYSSQHPKSWKLFSAKDGTAYFYKGSLNTRKDHLPRGKWEKASWSIRGDAFCVVGRQEICGTIELERNSRTLWWRMGRNNKVQITDMVEGDPAFLQRPIKFFGVKSAMPLKGKGVFFKEELGYSPYELKKPLEPRSKLSFGEVMGGREASGGYPSGFLVRVQKTVTIKTRTYSASEKQLRLEAINECLGSACPEDILFVAENRIITPQHFSKLMESLPSDKQPEVLWQAFEVQTGLTNSDGMVVCPLERPYPVVFNPAAMSEGTLSDLQSQYEETQRSRSNEELRQVLVGNTVTLSGSSAATHDFVYFQPDGMAFYYSDDGESLYAPPSGKWIKSKWKIDNGQICLGRIAMECLRARDCHPQQYQLCYRFLQDDYGRNRYSLQNVNRGAASIPTRIEKSESGDPMHLTDPIKFYEMETYHRRIGKRAFFRQRRSLSSNLSSERIINQSIFFDGKILGFRDQQDRSHPAGFLVEVSGYRWVQAFTDAKDNMLLGFPELYFCKNESCPQELRFVILPQEISTNDLQNALSEAYNDRAESRQGEFVQKAIWGTYLGLLFQNKIRGRSADQTPYEEMRREYHNRAQNNPKYKKNKSAERDAYQSNPNSPQEQKPIDPKFRLTVRDFNSSNPYVVLGVPSSASPMEIKKAYIALVKEFHPDRFQQLSEAQQRKAEDTLKKINAAYDRIRK